MADSKLKKNVSSKNEKLLKAYSEGRADDAESLARNMTRKTPKYALGWKILAVLLRNKGQLDEARKAIEAAQNLTPDDAELFNTLGNIWGEQGNWAEAEASYRKALFLSPKMVEAHGNLGRVLILQNRLLEGIESCEHAIAIDETHAEAHADVGAAYLMQGRLQEALVSLRQSVKLNSRLVRGFNNLGNTYKNLGLLAEAERSYRQAIMINAAHAKSAGFNLAILLWDSGRYEEAKASIEAAIKSGKSDFDANEKLHIGRYERQLIEHWLQGEMRSGYELSKTMPKHQFLAFDKSTEASMRFCRFMACLYRHWDSNNNSYRRDTAQLPVLDILGESHALPVCNVIVQLGGESFQSSAHVVMGIKMWHLAQADENYFRSCFRQHLSRLGENRNLMVTIGEVDCRPDEGIWPASRKLNKPAGEVVKITVEGYLNFLEVELEKYKPSSITIQGVPAPNYPLDRIVESEQPEFLDMFNCINEGLKAGALTRGWRFLDVYKATVGENGLSNQQWHLDGEHLKPDLYANAETWLISPRMTIENIRNDAPMLTFLHIGCGPKRKNQTTRGFNTDAWQELRFDIDESVKPDLIGTMTDMSAVADGSVDAIFSSHNIEHLYPHEVPLAFKEFLRVLKPDGFLVVTCPDLRSVCQLIAEDKLTDAAYTAPAGPIAPLDILYGHRPPMARGNLYMAHRCGFTQKVLDGTLRDCGFQTVASLARGRAPFFDLWAVASKSARNEGEMRVLAMEHFPK